MRLFLLLYLKFALSNHLSITEVLPLSRRGRFGGEDPKDPVPGSSGGGGVDSPAIPIGRPGGSTGGDPAAIGKSFNPPASYTATDPRKPNAGTYMQRGQQVQKTLNDAHGPDTSKAVVDYDRLLSNPNYKFDPPPYRIKIQDAGLDNLKAPLADAGIDGSTEFRFAKLLAGNPHNQPVSATYQSYEKKTVILSDLNNDNYGPAFKEADKAKQSQITYRQWDAEVDHRDLKQIENVIRSTIKNDGTRDIVKDIFGGEFKANSKETFSAHAAEGTREKATFDALSGTDNGRGVFLMLADNFKALGGKGVQDVTAYVEDNAWTVHLMWKLTM